MNLADSHHIILASKSPRRKDLLEQVGIRIIVKASGVDEKSISIRSPEEYAAVLSELKARDVAARYPEQWVLGADTIVVVDREILGKPESESHALEMLTKLNNRDHHVYTAFCLRNTSRDMIVNQVVKTRVCFKACTDRELSWYIDTGEPFGKAGGYAIQGKGAFMVTSISGSYTNVVGLPVCEVVEALKKLNLIQF